MDIPIRRYYTVTQEREVKVWANSPVEASQLGDAAFRGDIQHEDVASQHISAPVRDTSLSVREDY